MIITFTINTEHEDLKTAIAQLTNPELFSENANPMTILNEYTEVKFKKYTKKNHKLSVEDVHTIRELWDNGYDPKDIGKYYDVTPEYIKLIGKRKQRANC